MNPASVVCAQQIDNVVFQVPYEALPQREREFFEEYVAVTPENVIELCSQTVLQNNTEWKNARCIRITASSAYRLYTFRNNIDADEWKNKIENYVNNDFRGTDDNRHRLAMKDRARNIYKKSYE